MAGNNQQSNGYELVPQQSQESGFPSAISENNNSNRSTQASQSANRISSSRTYVMESGSTSKQYIAAFAGNLIAFTAGICLTWTSSFLVKLETNWKDESPLGRIITVDEKSWISSFTPLTAAISPFIAGYLANKIGRKFTLLIAAIPFIIGFGLMAITDSIIHIYVARLLWGLSVGVVFTVLPMYIGEIAQDEVRGALGSLMQLFITFGILWSSAVGFYTSWMVCTYMSMVLPVLFLIFFTFMPESPYHLCAVGEKEKAAEALMFFRGKSNDGVQKELEQIKCLMDEAAQQPSSMKEVFATPGRRKALSLSCGLVGFQQMSGINAVLFFSGNIFLAAGSDDIALNSCIVSLVQVLASAVTPLVADRLGRRILLIFSSVGMLLGLTTLGLYFNLQKHMEDVSSLAIMPLASLVVYMIVYCVGFGPLPWAVMGELFSNNVKSNASTLTASFCWVLGFFITKFFEPIKDVVGDDISFWFFAVCCIFATVFVFFLLPETKGKSLEEIQMILENRTDNNKGKVLSIN